MTHRDDEPARDAFWNAGSLESVICAAGVSNMLQCTDPGCLSPILLACPAAFEEKLPVKSSHSPCNEMGTLQKLPGGSGGYSHVI